MADIFLSYSRRDSENAFTLVRQLEEAGLSVWIDRHGIDGAEQWATEIVQGIIGCSTFVLLLSPDSILSENVLKELSLASEKGKRILPVDIGFVTLPPSFEYPLAGIQRVPITNFDAIVRAHHRGVERKHAKDPRKSLIILPFDDLSPQKDNQWFADGLAGEIISALATIKTLRVLDRTTSLELRGAKGTSREIAQLYDTRYIVEGSVTKFGDRIKISASLVDTHTREHVWQDSYKGVMDDIFELQESVTAQIVDGLKLHLTTEEKTKLAQRGTTNIEAYELYLRALAYYHKYDREGLDACMRLLTEAVTVDPQFAAAYVELANAQNVLYRRYQRDERVLEEAEKYLRRAEDLGARATDVYAIRGLLALRRGKPEISVEYAIRSAEADPQNARAYYVMGQAYFELDKTVEGADAFERYLTLNENDIGGAMNYIIVLTQLNDPERLQRAAARIRRMFERHIKFNPDDLYARSCYVIVLDHSGDRARAREVAEQLSTEERLPPISLFNLAAIYLYDHDYERAMTIIKRSIERGLRDLEALKYYEENNIPGTDEVVALMKQKIAEDAAQG